jgi:hypothetical protein
MRVSKDRAHLAAGEVQHGATRSVIDIRTGRTLSDERQKISRAAIADQVAGGPGHIGPLGDEGITHRFNLLGRNKA